MWTGDDREEAQEVLMRIHGEFTKVKKVDPRVLIYEHENKTRTIPNKRLKKLAIRAYKNNLKVIEKLDEWGLL